MKFIRGAFGQYTATPLFVPNTLYDYDCVIGMSYGTSENEGSPNADVRARAEREALQSGKPLILERKLADTYSTYGLAPDFTIEGAITGQKGGIGTYGALEIAKAYMDTHGLSRPLLVGMAAHINRASMQTRKIGLNPIIPPALPLKFDKDSEQIWTRSIVLWVPYELLASVWLKNNGKL